MRILYVCATPAEAVFSGLSVTPLPGEAFRLPNDRHTIDILITGVGMVATAYHLGRCLLQHKYDLAINFGICGAFDRSLLGKVVNVKQDCFADFGAEDNASFLNIFQTSLMGPDELPFADGVLLTDSNINNEVLNNMPMVIGITVNKSTGNAVTISKLKEQYHPDVESMEGAAFIYVCRMNKIPCLQVRSVSNFIEVRNRNAWKIEEALKSLKSASEALLMLL